MTRDGKKKKKKNKTTRRREEKKFSVGAGDHGGTRQRGVREK